MRRLAVLTALLFLAGGGVLIYRFGAPQKMQGFRTAPVKRGDLLVAISATGTVEPEEVVDIGAQVAGKVESFGADPQSNDAVIDYGSEVDVGTVLAQIDDSLYAADVASNEAQLEQATANVQRAQADLDTKSAAQDQAEAGVELAQITYEQLKNIPEESQSYIELETAAATLKQARATLEMTRATVSVGRASLAQAQKAVTQSKAELARARTNLDYCTIRSPVKGVIIDRRVNIGQTVVSSLNAPSLFLIAKDLKRIQVWASVNEADIGQIHRSQRATFTVDAYPNRTFVGEVSKIRLNATMTQNVVTYTVEVTTDNSDGSLLPYLTANVQFEVKNLKDALLVPNVALRWTPPPQAIVPDDRAARSAPTTRRAGAGARGADRVWTTQGSFVRAIPVRSGPSDGSQTQIESDALQEGTLVVVGEAVSGEARPSGDTRNPFAPQVFGSRRPQQQQ